MENIFYHRSKKGVLALLASLFLSWQCGSDGFLPNPDKLGGLADLDNYVNFDLTDLGSIGDSNGFGEWEDVSDGGRGANKTFVNWAKKAMELWAIGLELDNVQVGRHGAKNWITVAKENCKAEGVPDGKRGRNCGLKGSTIGICYYGFDGDGKITESIAIMEKSYLESGEEEKHKIGVFTHEIGHCLGLLHPGTGCSSRSSSGTNGCVMNPVVNFVEYGSDAGGSPASEEITAVREAYGDGTAPMAVRPSGPESGRFSECFDKKCYHPEFPVFHISGTIGRGGQQGGEAGEPLTYRMYIMRDDGAEEVRTTYPDGSVDVRIEGVNLDAGLVE